MSCYWSEHCLDLYSFSKLYSVSITFLVWKDQYVSKMLWKLQDGFLLTKNSSIYEVHDSASKLCVFKSFSAALPHLYTSS